MRIISKFRDYYDGAARDFSKDSLCFVRNTIEVPETHCSYAYHPKDVKLHPSTDKIVGIGRWIWSDADSNYFGVVGFCGKIYPYVRWSNGIGQFFYYNKKEVDDNITRRWNGNWFDLFNEPSNPLYDIFKRYTVPYFHLTTSGLTICPILRQLHFYKVFGVVSAYQEIEMYLGNTLHRRDNPYIAPVPDAIKAESHGFNKWSFRKEPSSWRRKDLPS